MDAKGLAEAVRELGKTLSEVAEATREPFDAELDTAKYLLDVLAHVVEGKTVARAFGAPGDWGYGTPIGKALATNIHPVDPGRMDQVRHLEMKLKALRIVLAAVAIKADVSNDELIFMLKEAEQGLD